MTWRRCCHPYFPVGDWPVHSAFCRYRPRVKLTFREEADFREFNRPRLPTLEELAAIASVVHEPPTLHLVDDAYIDAHLDDDDDRGGTW